MQIAAEQLHARPSGKVSWCSVLHTLYCPTARHLSRAMPSMAGVKYLACLCSLGRHIRRHRKRSGLIRTWYAKECSYQQWTLGSNNMHTGRYYHLSTEEQDESTCVLYNVQCTVYTVQSMRETISLFFAHSSKWVVLKCACMGLFMNIIL